MLDIILKFVKNKSFYIQNVTKFVFLCFIMFFTYPIYAIGGFSLFEHYKPQIDLQFKKGNNRNIGQVNLVLPVWQKESSLMYLNIVGMMDSNQAREGNFGMGYRQLQSVAIFGGYVFYDRRKTKFNKLVNQITVGGEVL